MTQNKICYFNFNMLFLLNFGFFLFKIDTPTTIDGQHNGQLYKCK